MKNIKLLMIGGLILLLAIPALASNGNPRLNNTTILGAGSALVFCNQAPSQDDTATAGSLYLLTKDTHYFVDTTAYSGYTKYGVTKTPVTTTNGYLLLKDSGKYAVASFTLGSPVGPADQKIETATWYKSGDPAAPSNVEVTAGFETAKATWQLSADYNYSSIELTLKKGADIVTNKSLGGSSTAYSFGKLVDGTGLDSSTSYEVSLVGKVKAKADGSSSYSSTTATKGFTTLTSSLAEKMETWTFRKPTAKTGINTFAIPFNLAKGIKDASGNTVTLATINDLIGAINTQAKAGGASGNVVTVFGWYDETSQQHIGLTSIPGGDLAQAVPTGLSATDILGTSIVKGQPYQVSVNTDNVTFKLVGFKD